MTDSKPQTKNDETHTDLPKELAQYQRLIEHMQFGLYIYELENHDDDRSLRMVTVNPAAEKLTGVGADLLVGRFIDDCFPGLREGNLPRQIADVVRTGRAVRFLDFDYGDDRVPQRAWAFKVVPLSNSLVGVLFEDVSERERALEAAKQSDVRFRALFERTNEAVLLYDLEGKIFAANQGAERISGYARDELIGRSYLDTVAPGERSQARAAFRAISNGEHQSTYERTVRRKDGVEVIIEIDASLVTDRANTPVHIQSISRDITERRHAEIALRESEVQFRTMVESAPEAIVVLDSKEERFIHANEKALALFKCDRNDIATVGPIDVSPERQHDGRLSAIAAQRYIERAVNGEKPVFEWTHQDLEGTTTLCEVRLVRLSAASPHLIRGSMTDISKRKRLERERVEFEVQLQQAQRLESLGVLAGGIAHDFNNMLVGVLGSATLALQELEAGHPVRKRLEQIGLAGRRAAELTNQLLVYAGKSPLKKALVDLNELIPEVEELLGAAVPKTMRLEFDLPTDPLYVHADRSQVQQVAMNLILNASEAMTESAGTVTVRLRSGLTTAKEDSRYNLLEVEDQGCGMDPETQQRILEPFFSTKVAGRGLGLATVSGIVRSHDGLLDIESAIGVGTTVRVAFPCADSPSHTDTEDETGADSWKGSGKVLVVDDDDAVRNLLTEQISFLGFDVEQARDGHEAVAWYEHHWQELAAVFMDQTMPKMDGMAAAKKMREISNQIPIVILSGYVQEEVITEAALGGLGEIAGFIQKPYRFEDVQRVLREISDQSSESPVDQQSTNE